MQMEKSSFQSLVQTMFTVSEQFREELEELIKLKITELANDLVGTHVQEFQESYLNQIKASADHILRDSAEMKLKLNHSDFEVLKSNSNFSDFAFEISEEADLRRGEFRLVAGSSGFQQKYID